MFKTQKENSFFNFSVFLLLILLLSSCNKDALSKADRELIKKEVTPFSIDKLPEDFTKNLEQNDLIILGEAHYVQEHQDFVVTLLSELSKKGYRIYMDELMHSHSWLVNDYVNGEDVELPEFILYFQETLIEGIKTFNDGVADSLKFQLHYMDVNHWENNFTDALIEIEKILGVQEEFNSIDSLEIDTDVYKSQLDQLQTKLSSNENRYISKWTQKWYDRILEIVLIEIRSSKFRTNKIAKDREQIMFDNIETYLQKYPNQKVIVNTGSTHAQKKSTDIDRIGKFISDNYNNTFSIVFLGMRGEKKDKFFHKAGRSFDLPNQVGKNHLIKIIDERAGDQLSFTPLQNKLFKDEDVNLKLHSNASIPLGLQYDAIISYPNISIVRSMDKYDWE